MSINAFICLQNNSGGNVSWHILCPLYEGVTRNIAFHTCYVICYVNNRKFNHVQNICEKVLLIQMSFTIYNYIII